MGVSKTRFPHYFTCKFLRILHPRSARSCIGKPETDRAQVGSRTRRRVSESVGSLYFGRVSSVRNNRATIVVRDERRDAANVHCWPDAEQSIAAVFPLCCVSFQPSSPTRLGSCRAGAINDAISPRTSCRTTGTYFHVCL